MQTEVRNVDELLSTRLNPSPQGQGNIIEIAIKTVAIPGIQMPLSDTSYPGKMSVSCSHATPVVTAPQKLVKSVDFLDVYYECTYMRRCC